MMTLTRRGLTNGAFVRPEVTWSEDAFPRPDVPNGVRNAEGDARGLSEGPFQCPDKGFIFFP